jgi:hypothetical protein
MDNEMIKEESKKLLNSEDEIMFILRKSMEFLMGKAIDLGRVSGMSDRSFQQFTRTMKDETNKTLEFQNKLLQSKGYLNIIESPNKE